MICKSTDFCSANQLTGFYMMGIGLERVNRAGCPLLSQVVKKSLNCYYKSKSNTSTNLTNNLKSLTVEEILNYEILRQPHHVLGNELLKQVKD